MTSTPPSDKENSSTLANTTPKSTDAKASQPSCPDDEVVQAKACPAADEFDDEDALEALVAVEEEEKNGSAV